MTTDFTLVSTERREPYPPVACRIVRRLRHEGRADLLLVQVTPPLYQGIYDTPKDLEHLILASRHEGFTLLDLSRAPMSVFICWVKPGRPVPESDFIPFADLALLDWGEVQVPA